MRTSNAATLPRYASPDVVLDDAVDAPLSELSIYCIFLWPFERITYTRLLFCMGYIVLTMIGLLAMITIGILTFMLLPCVLLDAMIRRYQFHQREIRWPFHHISLLFVDPLVFCDVSLHNSVCPKPYRINVSYSDFEMSPVLIHRAPFCCRMKTTWNRMDLVQLAGFYIGVRTFLCGFAIAWYFYILEIVTTFAYAISHWKDLKDIQFAFLSNDIGSIHDHFASFFIAMILNICIILLLRMSLVRVMCWSTRRYCCEHLQPSWIIRTSMTEVSASMDPFV